jgi:hypothetical protein
MWSLTACQCVSKLRFLTKILLPFIYFWYWRTSCSSIILSPIILPPANYWAYLSINFETKKYLHFWISVHNFAITLFKRSNLLFIRVLLGVISILKSVRVDWFFGSLILIIFLLVCGLIRGVRSVFFLKFVNSCSHRQLFNNFDQILSVN